MPGNIKHLLLLFTTVSLLAFIAFDSNWNIDASYTIRFSGTKAEGSFSGLTGTVVFDMNDLPHSKIDVMVDVKTIKTGNSTKDKHAIGDSWFDAAKYPNIKFTSSSFTKQDGLFLVTGILEMHGTKKEIQIPFHFMQQDNKGVFTGSFKVNRKDYGINGNMMEFIVGNEFTITLTIPVSKK